MPTYKLISSVTVGSGGAANIEFTSIPATYTDLLLKMSIRTNRALEVDGINITLNNSTSNFSSYRLSGDGSAVTSNTVTRNIAIVNANTATANTFSNNEMYIVNYAGSNNKSFAVENVAENNTTFGRTDFVAGLWSDTSAITSIKFEPIIGTSFNQYTTAYLYGISNA
jgi:hypothetical protein